MNQPVSVSAGDHLSNWDSASGHQLADICRCQDDGSHDSRITLFRRHPGPYQLMETIE